MLVADTSQRARITPLNALRNIRFSKRFGWRRSEYYAATRGGDLDTTQCRRGDARQILEAPEETSFNLFILFPSCLNPVLF